MDVSGAVHDKMVMGVLPLVVCRANQRRYMDRRYVQLLKVCAGSCACAFL